MAHVSNNPQWQDWPSLATLVSGAALENIELAIDGQVADIDDANNNASDALAAASQAATDADAAQAAADNAATAAQTASDALGQIQADSTPNADPGTLALRDANGNFRAADPLDPADVATKAYADSLVSGGGTPDATTSVKGKLKLAGDLSGTADLPTVPGLATKAPLANTTNAQTGTSYTPVAGDNKSVITFSNASGITLTLPSDANLAVPVGFEFLAINIGAGALTLAAGSGATVQGPVLALPQYGSYRVVKFAANTWVATAITRDATGAGKGLLQLAGDLGGTAAAPLVLKVNGVAISGTPTAGQVPIASSGTAAAWGAPAAAGSKPPAGTKVALIPGDNQNTIALQATWLNRLPIWIPTAITITEVAIEVTGAGTSPCTILMGLYTIAAVGGAGTKLHDFGSVSGTSTGVKTLTGSWAVPAGLYEFVFLPPDNAPTVRAGGNANGFAHVLPLAAEVVPGKRYLSDAPQTTLPSTSSASPSSNGNSGQGAVAAVRVAIS